jgi:2-amino-4-hydroxy-6-hydroxymethyldihydropteridine diphosphokinase
MADCLIALGSNLGDRSEHLRRAFAALAELPSTRLVARSRLYQSAPIGGPEQQGEFLNAAALLATLLSPTNLLGQLQRIEAAAERTPGERWAARPLDLDIAIYGESNESTPQLTLPHPRMTYRRFVLQPAADVAPWMLHAESGWTLQRLLEHLDQGDNEIAVASDSAKRTDHFIKQVATRLSRLGTSAQAPTMRPWSPPARQSNQSGMLPRLTLAFSPAAGMDLHQRRKMLDLPATGPVAWIGGDPSLDPLDEAVAAIQAVWPPPAAGH